jgi:hypothetical protein
MLHPTDESCNDIIRLGAYTCNAVIGVCTQFVQDAPVQDEAVKFMEVKQQVLMSYCLNMVFYMLAKVGSVDARREDQSPILYTITGRGPASTRPPRDATASGVAIRDGENEAP